MSRLAISIACRHAAACLVLVGALAACGGDSDRAVPDAGVDAPELPPPPPPPGHGALRFVHAAPASGALDVYLHGEATPRFTGIGYGTTTGAVPVPVGSYQIELRPAGSAATSSPSYSSAAVAIADAEALTAIGAGVLATDPSSPPPDNIAFRVVVAADGGVSPASGHARVRLVNTMYASAGLAIDMGDDGTVELPGLARFAISDAMEIATDHDLVLATQAGDGARARVGAFTVPAGALPAGDGAYVVLTGLSTLPPRDVRGVLAVIVPPPGRAPRVLRPDPIVYLVAASPDPGALDAVPATGKPMRALSFGAIASTTLPITSTGHLLEIRAAGESVALASLSTGPLEAGQQYLAVLSGRRGATGDDALALRVYRDALQTTNDGGRVRVIHAALGVAALDAGRYTTSGERTWLAIPELANLAPGAASPAAGTLLSTTGGGAVVFGARVAAAPEQALHFDSLPAPSAFDRLYAVLAGGWAPSGEQIAARYIIVKTAASNPWTTTMLAAAPDALALSPSATTLAPGAVLQYAAIASFGNGTTSNVSATATWTTSDAAVGKLASSPRGQVTAGATGATTITAKLGTLTATASLTVAVAGLGVASTQPADGATGVTADASLSIAFSEAVAPASLVTQTAAGACAGSLQLSADNFATCLAFATPSPALDAAQKVATLQPASMLSSQITYRLRALASITSAAGAPLGTDYVQATGFRITCQGKLVISQVYGGGSASGGVYRNDYVELHNAGGTAIDLSAYALQSGLPTGTTWTAQPLPAASIPPGGYFLLQEGGGTSTAQLPLPEPDAAPSPTLNLNGINGKLAITPLATVLGVACPLTASPPLDTLDAFGYGTGNCFEGGAAFAALTNATAAVRADAGCGDTDSSAADFASAAPAPRNSVSPPHLCACAE